MENLDRYKNLINEIIAKQIVILGSDISVLKAKNVPGLNLNAEAEVESIEGNPQIVLQKLVDEYMALSGQIMKDILTPILAKYPEIKVRVD